MAISERMSEVANDHQLAQHVAVLEERMNTMQAEYRTDIARLAEDMAKRDAEAAKRETRLILATAGMFVVGLTIFGFVTA